MGFRSIFHAEEFMKEYTIASVAAVVFTIFVDYKAGTRLFADKSFWIFWIVMGIFMTLINGYLTWRPIVIYGEYFQLGVRVFTIPIEDYLFGFSLISLNIITWEYFTRQDMNPKHLTPSHESNHDTIT
jgi:lycopene cyclase domain-containing protein